jgi:Domain of unknown function (DUF4252)
MRTLRVTSLLLILVSGSLAAIAEPSSQQPGWVPQSVEDLGRRASFHTDFTFDKSMLRMASNLMDNTDDDARRAINKLQAISVHSYHFSAPGLYDTAALDRIRAEYAATGWKHMVGTHGKGDPLNPGRTSLPGQTDLWISTSNLDVTGMVILLSDAQNFDLIALTGNLSPVDLLHLRGHFGIPKFDGDHLVPALPPTPRQ